MQLAGRLLVSHGLLKYASLHSQTLVWQSYVHKRKEVVTATALVSLLRYVCYLTKLSFAHRSVTDKTISF